MRYYENLNFKPKLKATDTPATNWGQANMQNLSWVEQVGCAVLNHLKCDEYLRATRIGEILIQEKRWDLVPSVEKMTDDAAKIRTAAAVIGKKMKVAFNDGGREVHYLGDLVIFRHEDEVSPQHGGKYYKVAWYHFMPDPDYIKDIETIDAMSSSVQDEKPL